jgi:hypothetical protein
LVVLPDSTQTGAPVLHDVVPARHGLLATMHAELATQSPHVPAALQTLSVPHDAPVGAFIPVSLHVGAALEQSSLPV